MEEIFNFDSLLNLLMNDKEATRELLKSYLTQTTEHLATLESLIKNGSFEEQREAIRKESHLLKGSSLNVSAKDLASTMLELEKSFQSISQEDAMKLYSLALEKWQVLQKEIEKVIN